MRLVYVTRGTPVTVVSKTCRGSLEESGIKKGDTVVIVRRRDTKYPPVILARREDNSGGLLHFRLGDLKI